MKIEDAIKQRKFKSKTERAMLTLLFTSASVQNYLDKIFKSEGITNQQFNVLRILRGSAPTPLSTKNIRDRMIDKMSDTPKIVDRLEKKKLVNKKTNPSDKRLVDVSITESGLHLLSHFDEKQNDFEKVFRNFSDHELQELTCLLEKIEC